MTQNQSISLCTNSSYFNFSEVFNTSVAFTNTYLYNRVYNTKYYNDFMAALGLNTADEKDFNKFKNILYSDSTLEAEFKTLMGMVYSNYKSDIC